MASFSFEILEQTVENYDFEIPEQVTEDVKFPSSLQKFM